MLSKFNKIISILLTIIFITGIFPPVVFAGPNPAPLGEVKGFNRTVIDSHFSRADREINPEQWLAEAKFGITQAICAWEFFAVSLYENPLLFEEAKAQIEKWSDEELEKRFSQWLMGRFFGKAAEEALINLSSMFSESQKYYSWHLDEEGNVIFDEKTGDPLVVRPNEEGREFSSDLTLWRNEAGEIVKTAGVSFNNVMVSMYPELLAYIPSESRESMSAIISESLNIQRNIIKQEFENIAAREERIFTNRRTRDIWSLRKKSDDEAARIFTEKLIAETDEACKKGIEELNTKIEQASAGTGDLAILGEEWLRLYKEQFERGLKAWEDAEERFFIRRIEWEQESFKLFSEGEEIWLSAFNQFEEQRQKWELSAKELFQAGETLFKNISEDFEKTIADAKKEFELNLTIRMEEGTNKVKALIDIYLICSSTAISSMDNIKFWQNQYGNSGKNIRDPDFSDWILREIENLWRQAESTYLNNPEYIDDCTKLQAFKSINDLGITPLFNDVLISIFGVSNYNEYLIEFNKKYSKLFQVQEILKGEMTLSEQIAYSKSMDTKFFSKFKFEALIEMQTSYNMYLSYTEKSLDARDKIYENYAELFGTGALKDILSPDVSSDDFFLDEYQVALLRAKALVLYWERKTSIADAVIAYAGELSSGRMTEAEGLRAWEDAKTAYNESLAIYETEINKLGKIGEDVQKQQEILHNLTMQMQREEDKLNKLFLEYSELFSMSVVSLGDYYLIVFNEKYNELVEKYKNFQKTGIDSVYISALEYGMLWDIAEQNETVEIIINILENSADLSEEVITALYDKLISLSPEFQNELWENTCNSLSQLFSDYDLQTETTIFPDVQSICSAIFNISGDFALNTAQFLTDFDNCFSVIPAWLQYEIDNWKEAIIEYITTFALFQKIQPDKNTTELTQFYNNLLDEYSDFYQYVNMYDYSDDDETEKINNKIIEITNKFIRLDYMYRISESWELLNLTASTENKTHWRQYLLNDYIANKDPSFLMVSSWTAGILEDALYYASYYTNRINDSFYIYSHKDMFTTNDNNDNAEQLYNLYSEEINKIFFNFNLLISQHNEIINASKAYSFSKLEPNKIIEQLNAADEAVKIQEEAVNLLRNEYYNEAEIFLGIMDQYDNQYNELKTAYNNTDQKRFEYEKQDAIQRWASTSYINADNIDPDNCRTNLLKAQTVLNILSDISNNKISSNEPEYEALYAAYEQSFTRKLKTLEVLGTLSYAYTQEKINNEKVFSEYQNSLYQLGTGFNYEKYNLPASRSEWKIENIIKVENGRLVFSRNESMYLLGVDSTGVNSVIDFFNTTKSVDGERFNITAYEEALRGLSQRMSAYFINQDKFIQWSYARNYLISSLIKANGDLNFLTKYLFMEEELGKDGSLASEYIKIHISRKQEALSSFMGVANEDFFRNEWNKLSAEEKADLEFYVILTLTTGNDYFAGFSKMYTYHIYEFAYQFTYSLYKSASKNADTWYLFLDRLMWVEVRDINKNTNNHIKPGYLYLANSVNDWINGLRNNLRSINNLTALYAESCKKLDELEGIKTEGQKITWADLEKALLLSKMKSEDISELKTYWEAMQEGSANNVYQNVSDAFMGLLYWTDEQIYYSKNNLETRISTDIQNQQLNEKNFLSIVDDYFSGTADVKKVKTAAENAYGKNTASVKYFLDNMYGVLVNNLSMYTNTDFNFYSLFSNKGEEIISLTINTIFNKYNAELTARETEWDLIRKDITEKYNEWQNTAAQIFENGRTDWTESYKKLQASYTQWNSNFKNEYERVNNEWANIYLAGLEDKEKWLQQAADAANQASSESFLSLVGSEGERLARFMDTREPFGIRDAVPEVQALMASLLQSSGIVNMENTFNSLNNYTGITSPLVRRGIGGASTWDSAFVKAAASDLARETNAEIAKNESRKLAYSARMAADEAVKSLTTTVNTANQSFRENIDNIFIFKGLWRKNGNNYVKDIVKGSTIFTPVISQTVSIIGYRNYIMEPVTLKTNLDDNHLSGLNTIAIQGLINNVYIEVKTIADDIFGGEQASKKIDNDREQSPGKFGAHIGYGPANKQLEQATKKRNEMFYDEGSGELGRLLSDFQYWYVIDRIGSAELGLAPWDKRIWNDEGSWFSAPSIRTVGTIAGSIVAGIASGGVSLIVSIGLSSASDIVFGLLDVTCGYKPLDEVAFSVGKSILTNTVTSLIGGAFNGMDFSDIKFKGLTNIAVDKAGIPFDKVLTKTIMTGTQTVTTGVATSIISGITYDSESKSVGYSIGNFNASMTGMFNSLPVSVAGAFTTAGLTEINSGLDFSKIKGFNNLNKADLQNLNGLIGSLAGQGVNYALGNDFTLNVLNLGLLSNNKYNSGLLELHLGRDSVSMSMGTGGANVSIDNLISAYRGAQVWDVNTKISKAGKANNFDALIALRVQYGHGDSRQKEQLWDILNGKAIINTDAEEGNIANITINEDGKRVINLTGYKEGMSKEDQYLLGVVLGYEAYRDENSSEKHTDGNLITDMPQFTSVNIASAACLDMVDRIQKENDWFNDVFDRFAFRDFIEKDLNVEYLSAYNDYYRECCSQGVINFNTDTKGDYQNNYPTTPLFNSYTQAEVDEINDKRQRGAYVKYAMPVYSPEKYGSYRDYLQSQEYKDYAAGLEAGLIEFKKDEKLMKENGYIEEPFISISISGCTFMSTKYILEAVLGNDVAALPFHNDIKNSNYFTEENKNELSRETMADIITKRTNGDYTVQYLKDFGETLTPATLTTINSSNEQYFIHLRVENPYDKTQVHSVVVKSIEYTKDKAGNITGIEKFTVANPLQLSKHPNTQLSFTPSYVVRTDTFFVTNNKK